MLRLRANAADSDGPRSGPFLPHRWPCVGILEPNAPRSRVSDDTVCSSSYRRTVTAEALLPIDKSGSHRTGVRSQGIAALSHVEGPRRTDAATGRSPGGGEAAGRSLLSQSRNSSSSVSTSTGSSSGGAAEFAEVYLPRRSRLGPQKSAGSGQSGEAPAELGEPSDSGGPSQGGAASSPASAEKKSRPARRQRETPPLLSATDAAVAHIKELVKGYNERLQHEEARGAMPRPRACGIRISLQKQGCSGMAYDVAICTEEPAKESTPSHNPADWPAAADARQPRAEAPVGPPPRRGKNWRDDEVVAVGGVEIRVAADAVMLLVGTQVDFVDEEVQTGFVFNNPNQKQSCGCGKSFMV